MKVSYKTTIDEAVDCHVRKWWLQKSSKWRFVRSLISSLVVWSYFTYLFVNLNLNSEFLNALVSSLVFFSIVTLHLTYAYGFGFRRRIKKCVIGSLDGEPFPESFSCEITPECIMVASELAETKFDWKHIKDIRIYKQYIEIVGRGFLIHLRCSESPPIDEIIAVWKQA